MAIVGTECAPARPARWVCGDGVGIQVWELDADARERAALYVGAGGPLVLVNRLIVGTALEWPAVTWALEWLALSPPPGIYYWLT